MGEAAERVRQPAVPIRVGLESLDVVEFGLTAHAPKWARWLASH